MQLKSADAANTQLVPHSPFHMHHMHHLHLRPWAVPGSSRGHRRRTGCGCGADWRAGCEPDYRPVRPTSSPTQPVPDPSSSDGRCGPPLTASSSSRGRFRTLPHTTPWSSNWLILRPALPPLFAFLFFRFVPHFCPNRLAASQLLPATVCMCVFPLGFVVCVCVCVCECVGVMMQQAAVQPRLNPSLCSARPPQLLSIFKQRVKSD